MAQNWFLYRLLPKVVASVFVLQIDEVETKFLTANSISEFSHSLGHMQTHALQHAVKQKDRLARRSLRNLIRCFGQAASAVAAFFFLRQPSKPNAPRPVAKSGRAAGSGVDVIGVNVKSVPSTPNPHLNYFPEKNLRPHLSVGKPYREQGYRYLSKGSNRLGLGYQVSQI